MRRWRKMTWVLVVWCAAIVVWAVAGASSAGKPRDCSGLSARACEEASNAGTGIGVAIILFIGFVGFVFFALIWLMSRPRG